MGGTIDNNPEVAHLCRALGRDGHKIIIVTASEHDKKAVKAKLYGLNIEWYYKLVIIPDSGTDEEIGKLKGDACNKWKVSVYFDNNPKVLEGFAITSKIARVLVVEPRAGMKTVKKVKEAARESIDCPCNRVNDYRPARCYHCTATLHDKRDRVSHTNGHHGLRNNSPD